MSSGAKAGAIMAVASLAAIFSPVVQAATPQEGTEVRSFVGDGTPYLPLPGCKSVSSVRVSGVEVPPFVENKFPVGQGDNQEFIRQLWPLYELSAAEDGTPVLLRSVQSNDGIWQQGAVVTIGGEWEAAEPGSASEKPKGKAAKEPEA